MQSPPLHPTARRWPRLVGLLLLLAALLPPLPAVRAGSDSFSLDKARVAELLKGHTKLVARARPFTLRNRRLGPLTVEPTLHPQLQRWALRMLEHTRHSRRAAIVVMEADTGRVLVLAGARRGRPDPSVALDASAPAASLFKMVTAAATLEKTGLQPGSTLFFTGRPHTLYRFQVRKHPRRRPRRISLKKSFAQSNNPVFARLGIHRLGGDTLERYARALGFGRRLGFELPLGISRLAPVRDRFQVGELACGFNRKTTISPLHAALLVSVFLNHGRLMEPFVVRRVMGGGGEVLYLGRPRSLGRLVSGPTCHKMREMFRATVRRGTARRAFRRVRRDRVLRDKELGGKTGTLRGPDKRELFEWFAGYGLDRRSGHALAITTLVVHGRTRYDNPKRLARRMLHQAFKICLRRGRYLCADRLTCGSGVKNYVARVPERSEAQARADQPPRTF